MSAEPDLRTLEQVIEDALGEFESLERFTDAELAVRVARRVKASRWIRKVEDEAWDAGYDSGSAEDGWGRPEEVALLLWGIYLDACICSVDYFSTCDCRAGDLASSALEDLLGEDWHEIMRKRTGKN